MTTIMTAEQYIEMVNMPLTSEQLKQAIELSHTLKIESLNDLYDLGSNMNETIKTTMNNLGDISVNEDEGVVKESVSKLLPLIKESDPMKHLEVPSTLWGKLKKAISTPSNNSVYDIIAQYLRLGYQIKQICKILEKSLTSLESAKLDLHKQRNGILAEILDIRIVSAALEYKANQLLKSSKDMDKDSQNFEDTLNLSLKIRQKAVELSMVVKTLETAIPQTQIVEVTIDKVMTQASTVVYQLVPFWEMQVALMTKTMRHNKNMQSNRIVESSQQEVHAQYQKTIDETTEQIRKYSSTLDTTKLQLIQAQLLKSMDTNLENQKKSKEKEIQNGIEIETMRLDLANMLSDLATSNLTLQDKKE